MYPSPSFSNIRICKKDLLQSTEPSQEDDHPMGHRLLFQKSVGRNKPEIHNAQKNLCSEEGYSCTDSLAEDDNLPPVNPTNDRDFQNSPGHPLPAFLSTQAIVCTDRKA